ncbi:MAG: hypothetical protein U0903_19800 [Planctomycetales bacterium]
MIGVFIRGEGGEVEGHETTTPVELPLEKFHPVVRLEVRGFFIEIAVATIGDDEDRVGGLEED